LEILRFLVTALSAHLMAPMIPIIAKFASVAESDPEHAFQIFADLLNDPSNATIALKYLAGFSLPLLFFPVVIMATARVALGLWDGYAPGPSDVLFALKKYWASMVVCFYISLYMILAFLLLMVVVTPMAILTSVTKNPMAGGILAVAGLAIGVVIFYHLFWPFFRRSVCLQFLPFFVYFDGKSRDYAVSQIFYRLESFPSHCNQATGLMILVVVIPGLILGGLLFAIAPAGNASLLLNVPLQLILDLLILWPLTALAGFYRLVLYPRPEEDA
jgi:hypothetical protein